MKRILARGSLVLAVAALAASGLASGPAGAATAQQTCKTVKGTATLSPGLSTTPHAQKATATANLSGCTVASKTGGAGVMKATLSLASNSSCQGLATGNQTIKLAATITWKNKKTSTMALTAKTGSGSTATQATITGKVSKGLFPGRPVTLTIKFTPKSGQDCTPGHPIKNLTIANTKPLVIH
jgi:hypothetical protein